MWFVIYIICLNMDEWVRKFNITDRSSGSPFSNHCMFENITYFFSEDKYDEFLMVYAKCIDSNEKPIVLQEIITDHAFKMFFDVDFLEPIQLSSEYILNFSHTLHKIIFDLLGGSEDLTYVISTTQPTRVTKSSNEYIKTGLHINYPFLYVNCEIAIKIRNRIVNDLVLIFGERPEINKWEDVIDINPYNSGAGLKMHGSVKPLKCSGCIGRGKIKIPKMKAIIKHRRKFYKKENFDYCNLNNFSKSELDDPILNNLVEDYNTCMDCDKCNGKRKVLENRFYSVGYVFNNDGSFSAPKTELLRTNTLECMKMTSIRCKLSEKCTLNFTNQNQYEKKL